MIANDMAVDHQRPRGVLRLTVLIAIHIVICCAALVRLANSVPPIAVDPVKFHMFFSPERLWIAILSVALFAIVGLLFAIARFSIGYFIAFYLYSIVLNYLWLNSFSDLKHDHLLAGLSVAASCIAFMLPALFVTAPVRPIYRLSPAAFDRLLLAILLLSSAVIAAAASYNFRLVWVTDIYDFRDSIESPRLLRYLLGVTSSALLPFAFASFIMRKAYWRACAVLLLLLACYPITLGKQSLLAPFWLVGIFVLARFFEARTAVILSLLAPLAGTLGMVALFKAKAVLLLSIVNFRMITVPAIAIDIYNDFFSRHDITHFCQITFLKPLMDCPYQDQLSVVMENAYGLGNFNGSLFATEGIASVGLWLAPLVVFACGLVIAVGNRLSAGLPAGFVLVSGAILPQVLINVPLTTALLTHGAALLFLLWYITPRTIFEPKVPGERE